MSDPVWRLGVFGGLSVQSVDGARTAMASQRKRLALLALLAGVGEAGMSRDKITALLWPESDDERARNALHQVVHGIRRELGNVVASIGGDLKLDSGLLESDLADFERALAARDLERAVALHAGPFLDGFYIRDASEFERWVEAQRAEFAAQCADALESLAARCSERGDAAGSVSWWRKRIELDPLSSRIARRYMDALVEAGDREAAIRYGRVHLALVRSELAAEPDEELRRYVDGLALEPTRSAGLRAVSAPRTMAAPLEDHAVRTPIARKRTDSSRRRVARAVAIPGLLVGLGAVAVALDHRPGAPPRPSIPVVLVAPFDAPARDTALAGVARVGEQVVVQAVARSGVVGVVDANMVARLPTLGTGSRGDSSALADLARTVRATIVVDATLERGAADSLVLHATILSATSGRVLAVPEPVRGSRGAGLSVALAQLASRVTGALASLVDPRVATVRDASGPVPNFEAYREYVDGLDAFVGRWTGKQDYLLAARHFRRAAALDTSFNLPLIWLVWANGNAGGPLSLRDSVINVLGRRWDRLSPLDRLALDYFRVQRPDTMRVEVARKAYPITVAAVPLAPESNWNLLRAREAMALERFDDAAESLRELDAAHAWIQSWTGYWYLYDLALHESGRYEEEIAAARRAPLYARDVGAFQPMFRVLGARGDVAAIRHLIDSLTAAVPELASFSPAAWLRTAANEAEVHEHFDEGKRIAEACVAWQNAHPPDHDASLTDRAGFQDLTGYCAYLAGSWDQADSCYAQEMHYGRSIEGDVGQRSVAAGVEGQLMDALRRGDSAQFRRLYAIADTMRFIAARSSEGAWLRADIAAVRGDAHATAAALRFAREWAPASWHEDPDISAAIRRTPEVQQLIASPFGPVP